MNFSLFISITKKSKKTDHRLLCNSSLNICSVAKEEKEKTPIKFFNYLHTFLFLTCSVANKNTYCTLL